MKYKVGQVWTGKKGCDIKIVDIAKDGKMLATVNDSFYLEFSDGGIPENGYEDQELIALKEDVYT